MCENQIIPSTELQEFSLLCNSIRDSRNKMKLIAFFLYSILITIESSKCPESRKPHSTSCTIFYNCVNLPSGGYVWIPSKCIGNLVRFR